MFKKGKELFKKTFAVGTAFAIGAIAVAGPVSEENMLKNYYQKNDLDMEPEKVLIYDLNDNLLWSEDISNNETNKSTELIKLLDKSDYLFKLDDTVYFIKTN